MTLDERWLQVRDRWPVRVKSATGAVVLPFSIMRITGSSFSNDEILYATDMPNTSFQRLYLVSGPFAIGVNGSDEGLATFLSESGPVRYTGTPTVGDSFGPTNGSRVLSKWQYGFTITGGTGTASGNNVVIAKQHEVMHVWGQTDGAISKGGTGTVEVYDGNDTVITSVTLTGVKNKRADVGDNKKVKLDWLGGSWYIGWAEATSQTVITDFQENGGGTAIEGEELDIWVETTDTAASTDKVTITECP